MFKIDAGSL